MLENNSLLWLQIIHKSLKRQVYIVCGRTDMRRGIDGLAAIVKDKFDLDPEKYLKYLLYKLPNESTLTDKEALSAYLPWTKQVQASCR